MLNASVILTRNSLFCLVLHSNLQRNITLLKHYFLCIYVRFVISQHIILLQGINRQLLNTSHERVTGIFVIQVLYLSK